MPEQCKHKKILTKTPSPLLLVVAVGESVFYLVRMVSDNEYSTNGNSKLKKGICLYDIFEIFHKYNVHPLDGVNQFLALEFALLIGFEEEKEQKHFEKGLEYLRKDSGYVIKSK